MDPALELVRSRGATAELVDRVASSRHFQKSPKLRELLHYICTCAMENRPDDVREQLIGANVYGRKPDYSPGDDNIVRVEMRRLRKRLADYFSSEGAEEPVVILIPTGSYLPLFQPRAQANLPGREEAKGSRTRRAVIGLLIAAAGTAGFWIGSGTQVKSLPGGDREPLWPLLLNRKQDTLIVCADSSLVMAQAIRQRMVGFEDYASRNYEGGGVELSGDSKRMLSSVQSFQFTDVADVRVIDRFHTLNAEAWERTSMRSARGVQAQDFASGNAILLGSARSNPWVHLFERHLSFRIDFDPQTGQSLVRNLSPLPEEQPVYWAANPNQVGSIYSTVAFLPNLSRTGYVLIVAGTTGQGTESAGEYISTPATYAQLMKAVQGKAGGALPYFEVLLKSATFGGAAERIDVVSIHTIAPDAADVRSADVPPPKP